MREKEAKETPALWQWIIIAGGNELHVRGAYVQWHEAPGPSPSLILFTVKDENHKTVFEAPAGAVAYVLRADTAEWAESPRDRLELYAEQIRNSIRSIDEVREEMKLTPWGLPETSVPLRLTAGGLRPLTPETGGKVVCIPALPHVSADTLRAVQARLNEIACKVTSAELVLVPADPLAAAAP